MIANAVPTREIAALLRVPAERRHASPWLVALTGAMLVRVVPYLFAFAGVDDHRGWLVFAPCDLALSWGPLLWGYVSALTSSTPTPLRRRHFAPGALHVIYQIACLVLPLDAKVHWYFGPHSQFVQPAVAAFTLVSFSLYGFAAWTTHAAWRTGLGRDHAPREDVRLWLLRALLCGIALTAVLGALLLLVHLLIVPLIYLAKLPEALTFATLAYVVTVLAVRAAQAPSWPTLPSSVVATTRIPAAIPRDAERYRVQAEAWRARVVAAGWHRDATLTLDVLASTLHTSPRTLSRTLKEGLGVSFNTFVNELRIDEATILLAAPHAPTVLDVAYAVGFSSKASFHRAFKRRVNSTPSELRARVESQDPPVEPLATGETTA